MDTLVGCEYAQGVVALSFDVGLKHPKDALM